MAAGAGGGGAGRGRSGQRAALGGGDDEPTVADDTEIEEEGTSHLLASLVVVSEQPRRSRAHGTLANSQVRFFVLEPHSANSGTR
jgi:hypothetical protein